MIWPISSKCAQEAADQNVDNKLNPILLGCKKGRLLSAAEKRHLTLKIPDENSWYLLATKATAKFLCYFGSYV